jgi:hypothetical protein
LSWGERSLSASAMTWFASTVCSCSMIPKSHVPSMWPLFGHWV